MRLPTQQPTLEEDSSVMPDHMGIEGLQAGGTGAFAPLGATASFAPVSEELFKYHDGTGDIYVHDADDSALVSDKGGGYASAPQMTVMPASRARTFFGKLGDRLSGRRKREAMDNSPSSWLGVGEDYDARKAGGKIGNWSNFSEETGDSWGDDEGWKGGAYGSGSYRDDFKAIYDQGQELIDREVWLVATGSQEAEGAGIKALIARHVSAMRGSVIINLDSVGAGELCYTTVEGQVKPHKTDQRLQNLLTAAADSIDVRLDGVRFAGYQSDAAWALAQGVRAISLIGLDQDYPVAWRSTADDVTVLEEEKIVQVSEIVYETIKSS
jgi:hypothetical protein